MENVLVISVVVLWIVVLINLALTMAIIRRLNTMNAMTPQPIDMLDIGTQAPAFNIETMDGQTVSDQDYANREKIMVFVAPGCEPCSEQMPKLQEAYYDAQKSGIELMVISLDNAVATKQYAEQLLFTAPILAASAGANPFVKEYKVSSTPSYYLIDSKNTIKEAGPLAPAWNNLVQKMQNKIHVPV